MSTFSKDYASSSCSSSTAANALRQLRGDEEEGGVRDMRNAKVDIFSRLFVGLGLCLAFRVNAQQVGMSSLYCCFTLLYFTLDMSAFWVWELKRVKKSGL